MRVPCPQPWVGMFDPSIDMKGGLPCPLRAAGMAPPSRKIFMRTISLCGTAFFVIGAMFIMSHRSPAADYPEIDKLPARMELPDPLVMFDGTPVTTRKQWTERRAPELKALFQHYMYGDIPAAPKISATV